MVDLVFEIGGPQGGGIESAGQIALRAFMLKGYRVYGTREYHSNIMGKHSYFNIRVREDRALAPNLPADIVVALDAESVFTHYNDVGEFLVYDTGVLSKDIDSIQSMSKYLKARVKEELDANGVPHTVEGVIKLLEKRGKRLVGVPLRSLLKTTAEKAGVSLVSISRAINTIGLAVGMSLIGVEVEKLQKAIELFFAGKQKVIKPNVIAAQVAYDYAKQNFGGIHREVIPDGPHINTDKPRLVVSGNDVVAMGKIAGGLRVQTYYPITPAADESLYLEKFEDFPLTPEAAEKLGLERGGIVVVQTEDEISALNMAIGASLAGARSATSTSGPGLSLMAEALGYAGIIEAPVVITLYMRGGPSTGMPTRNSQSDLFAALFQGHGDLPRIVIASGDHEEAFYDAIKALNWAEKYQTPVIHLLEKAIANAMKDIFNPDLSNVVIDRGKIEKNPPKPFPRFKYTEDGISPRAFLGDTVVWYTSNEHDQFGRRNEDPVERIKMQDKRLKKFETAAKEIPLEDKVTLYGDPDAKITIVGWGAVKGAALDAIDKLKEEGINANYLHIRMFMPFPSDYVKSVLEKAETVIGVEGNALAQAAQVIRMFTGFDIPHLVVKYTGRPIFVAELVESVKHILRTGDKKVVLSLGQ
ncbi:MAG: 2-oxoacid:acceptor oxidoreductase subunit alpha [Desulfurococcales archaeon]|nr:2-oxoacid:acceptor oxidoreductase subunit alpha [Desulfurococcales archaeon]